MNGYMESATANHDRRALGIKARPMARPKASTLAKCRSDVSSWPTAAERAHEVSVELLVYSS